MTSIPLQPVSEDIWDKKYRLRSKSGEAIDASVEGTFRRVAKALASVEKDSQYWERKFFTAMMLGAIPAGRIMSNAGAGEHKPNASTINCTVSNTIHDSMHGILQGVYEGGITLAAGCGIGYDFTTLRPRDAYVAGVGAKTSGALSFMNIYDSMCFTVASAGGRRGAQMGTMDIRHPDIESFITAKREDGRLRQFNLSVLITDKFMKAVREDKSWQLIFPVNPKEDMTGHEWVWARWPGQTEEVKCRVYKRVSARDLWDSIMRSNYDFAEPGFILIDRYNEMNNNWFCEDIRATNPCGEQGLPPYGACLLGSINLTKFVENPFTENAYFNMQKFRATVFVFTRMLDNVVEINGLPLKQQQEEIIAKRRHGMGFFGLGSALAMMRVKYDSHDAAVFTGDVSKQLAMAGLWAGVELAKEKGEAPILQKKFFQYGNKTGRELLLNSGYMRTIFEADPELVKAISQHGIRFTHHSSIAPTGTISLSFGNNVSNGIEPTFSHEYQRNVIREGRNTKEAVTVYSYEALLWKSMYPDQPYPDYFSTADDISPSDHINIQAASQRWIDSSISKTVNVPSDISFKDFESVYMEGYEKGCKGVSTFRFNPTAFQGVLVKKADLEATLYRFVTEDGSEHEYTGDQLVEYDGQQHTAANLFDALKEGTYGRMG